jgi:hypothetical protein
MKPWGQNKISYPHRISNHDSSVDQNVAYSRYGTRYPGSCQRANEAIKHTCFIQSKILYFFLIFINTSEPDDNRTHPGNFLAENGQLNAPLREICQPFHGELFVQKWLTIITADCL